MMLLMFRHPIAAQSELQSRSQRFLSLLTGSNHDGILVKEDLQEAPSRHDCPPQPSLRLTRARRNRLHDIWSKLPELSRHRVVQALRRLLVQKLLDARGREASHDHA
jgi:hypothetical protein